MRTYSKKIKVLENCTVDKIESISKSLQRLQRLRHRQNMADEISQYQKFVN